MNRKSLAITASLFAATLAVPPPMNIVMGVPLFCGLKLYRTAIVFLGVSVLIYSGPIIGFITTNQFGQMVEAQETFAQGVANATMADPSMFPYVLTGLLTMIGFEVVMVLGLFVFPAYLVRKKVYPHVKQQLGHET